MAKAKEAKQALDQLNETGNRSGEDRRKEDQPVKVERRKVQRRRQIDPTTCERDYKGPEIEFMQALDAYKRRSGRMFPTCSEILEVVQELGYRQLEGEELEAYDAARAPEIECEGDAETEEDIVEAEAVEYSNL